MVNVYDIYKNVGGVLLHIVMLMLSGCVAEQAPVIILLGSYFPSWIACTLFGIVAAIIARVIFIYLGIDEELPARLLFYTWLALAVAFASSLLIFAR